MQRGSVTVEIKADTREFRRQLTKLRLSLERSAWRRFRLRLELARIAFEKAP